MITHLPDGFTLQYTDPATGQTALVSTSDYALFSLVEDAGQAQYQANRNNTESLKSYMDAVALYNSNQTNNIPVKPKRQVVDDLGNVRWVDFTPALPDITPRNVQLSTGEIKQENAPLDPVQARLAAISADLKAIRIKLQV